eukprot:Transcript_488.p2 GENE.Transcript_488~~Transcript_488.p2  ORF type:complete len:295 (-),score=62.49 Transcript_488:52-936(-)
MLTLFSSCVWALAPTPGIVFTDCDGTMLRPDHTLSPAATAMLHTLHDRGIRVVPATGRARAGPWTESVLNTHPVLQRGNPGVYINGCCAFTEDGEALASTYLPPAVVERVLHWWTSSVDAKGSGLVAYVGGEALHVPGQSPASEQALVERLGALGDSPPRAVARSEVPVSEVFKMIVTVEEAARDQALRPLLAALLKADAGLTQAIPGYLEIVPTTATKATACAALLERWGLSWEQALAIGDGSNDLPMLQVAGTSVAMGNAGEGVKAAAQHIVGTNAEDGWVEAMERLVLDRL